MDMFFITLGIMVLFTCAMAVGVLAGRKPLQGSCGGLGALMGEDCEFCDKKERCKRKKKADPSAAS